MTVSAILLALTGLQLGWTVAPSTAADPGSIAVSATIEEGDLVFVRENGIETASFETVVTIAGGGFARSGGTVTHAELPYVQVLTLEDIDAGRQDLVLMVRDLESGRTTRRETSVEVPLRTAERWSSSLVQIAGDNRRIAGSIDFSWQVFPPEGSELPDSLEAAFLLRSASGDTALEGWLAHESAETYRGTVSLGLLPAGEYDLTVAAVLGSEIQTSSVILLEIRNDWDVWGGNASLTADLVRPIAGVDLLEDLDRADSEAGRRATMSQFWQEKDPTPMTPVNEYLDMYLERLDYIMEHFSTAGTIGIDTDMGRVYALMGEPDILEDMPFETDDIPYQVWTYFTPAITVVFADEYGIGIYELVTSWAEIRRAYERI